MKWRHSWSIIYLFELIFLVVITSWWSRGIWRFPRNSRRWRLPRYTWRLPWWPWLPRWNLWLLWFLWTYSFTIFVRIVVHCVGNSNERAFQCKFAGVIVETGCSFPRWRSNFIRSRYIPALMNQAKRKCIFKIRPTTNIESGVLSWKVITEYAIDVCKLESVEKKRKKKKRERERKY